DRLRGERALLVVDNCEHVVEAAAALVEQLLIGCPELRVLATSREPLMLESEQLRQVYPLELLDAGQALADDALQRHSALRLAVCAGGFDLASAQQVAGREPISREDVVDLLSRLVDRSLVRVAPGPDGDARYRLLDTLRAFGRQRLDAAGESDAVHRRHAEH